MSRVRVAGPTNSVDPVGLGGSFGPAGVVPDMVDVVSAGTAHERLARLVRVVEELIESPSLEPDIRVNALFNELVRLCRMRWPDPAGVLSHPAVAPLVTQVRRACSTGEFLLERAWARRIIADHDPSGRLTDFPYWDNYRQLTRLEVHSLAAVGLDTQRPHRVCFLGGGPLPLSALMLGRELDALVDVVEIDPDAARLAAEVVRRTSVQPRVQVHVGDALDHPGLSECDVVVMAALVGADPEAKQLILRALAERASAGTFLVIRSAQELRSLLYPPLEVADLPSDWRVLAVTHPYTCVVNSVVVAVRTST